MDKKKMLIVGAGGFGRELLAWTLAIQSQQNEWQVSGFLDANLSALDSFDYEYPIVGTPDTFTIEPDFVFACGLGDPAIKLAVCRQMLSRGAQFVTLVHPTAVIGLNSKIGIGCILCPGAIVTSDVILGDFVTLNAHATVGHDVVVGDGCTLSGHVDVTGASSIGEGVFLGTHATILPGVKVGERARIGAGSVVIRHVKPDTTVFGSPAKPLPRFQ
jgi:sugar O-acyltransferase (sialic acid O-acetyltransferase NeuD family)